MPIHDQNTISTGYGWVAVDGSCLPVNNPHHAMSTLMQHATWLRKLYNTVIDRDTPAYYRFLLHAYDRGYMLVGRQSGVLGVESCSASVFKARESQIMQICKDSADNQSTLLPRRFIYSAFDPVTDPVTRRQFFSENLKPPLED